MSTTAFDQQSSLAIRRQLWFGLLGGGFAWLVHFLTIYVAAEFGCVSGWGSPQWMGISAVSWLVLAVSIVMAIIGVAATWFAWRAYHRFPHDTARDDEQRRGERYLAKAGALTSGIFVVVILFETIPVFFYLQQC